MLDQKLLRTNAKAVAEQLKRRGFILDVDAYETLEKERKTLQTKTEELQAKRNAVSKSIGQAKSKGEDVAPLMKSIGDLGGEFEGTQGY